MVKKFFMLTALLSFSSTYSMMEEHLNGVIVPRIEIQGPEHHRDTTLDETEAERLRMRENDNSPRSTDSRLSHYTEGELDSMPSTPRFIPVATSDSGVAGEIDRTTEGLSPLASARIQDFEHSLSYSPKKPQLAKPEPIQANDEEIVRLTEAYKEARAALPEDLVGDYLARDEYQAMVKSKQGVIKYLKDSNFSDKSDAISDAIIARQEKLITYLKDKISSIASRDKLELRQALEKTTDLEIADIEENIAASKIKDKTALSEINKFLRNMKDERNFLSERTLLSDENFETIMSIRAIRIQDNARKIEELLSPNPKPHRIETPTRVRVSP